MPHLPETMSPLEAGWLFAGIFGVTFSLVAMYFAARTMRAVVQDIRGGTASYVGPRWLWSLWFFLAMLAFLLGWLGFAAAGFIVSSLPDTRPTREISLLEALLEGSIVGGEICFAIGQAGIVTGWVLTRRAAAFIAPHLPQENHTL